MGLKEFGARARLCLRVPLLGKGQDDSAVIPEVLWNWSRVDTQVGHVYIPRTGHAVIVWNHDFYVMGGTDENARQNDIYRYDVRGRTWKCIDLVSGQAPSVRSGSKAVVCRDSIYFFGGHTKNDRDYFNDLFEFNIPRAHWTNIDTANRPSVRSDHSCVVFEGKLYIFGGFDGRSRLQDLHQYDVEERQWIEIPASHNVPMGRFGHSAVVYRSGMFVFGGWNGYDSLDDLYECSLTTMQWYSVPGRGNVPASSYRHSAVVHGCCMFVFGGENEQAVRFADLCEFNFNTRSWAHIKTQADQLSARTFHQAVIYASCMYILGGFDGTRQDDMYKITLPEQLSREDKQWAPVDGLRLLGASAGTGAGATAAPVLASPVPELPMPNVLVVNFAEAPYIHGMTEMFLECAGRYQRVPRRKHNGFGVWRKDEGKHLLYSTRLGYWAISDSDESMRYCMSEISSSVEHEGKAPNEVLAGSWATRNDNINEVHHNRDELVVDPNIYVVRAEKARHEADILVLTLHIGEAGPNDHVDVVVTNIGGDELACVDADPTMPVSALWTAIQHEMEDQHVTIATMLPDGRTLDDGNMSLADALAMIVSPMVTCATLDDGNMSFADDVFCLDDGNICLEFPSNVCCLK